MSASKADILSILKQNGIDVTEAALKMGMSRNNFYYHLNKSVIDYDFLKKLADKCNIGLITNVPERLHSEQINTHNFQNFIGRGSVNKKISKILNEDIDVKYRIKADLESNHVPIPMYNSPTTASGVEVYNDQVQEEPAFKVNIPQFQDCDFGKLVFGHSMHPVIESGTYVFCKSVENKRLILYGEIYYIEADNYAFVRRVQKGDLEGELLLTSDNDELRRDGTRRYETITIQVDQIRRIWIVKGYFKQTQN